MTTEFKNTNSLKNLFHYLSENSEDDINETKQNLIESGINPDDILGKNLPKIQELISVQELKRSNNKELLIAFIKKLHKELFLDEINNAKESFINFANSNAFSNNKVYALKSMDSKKAEDIFSLLNYETLCNLIDEFIEIKHSKG